MPLTLNETKITVNETFNEMLEELQGNILKHHGREHAFHIFTRFKSAKSAEIKAWIRGFAAEHITSAKKQLLDAQARRLESSFDGGVFYTLSLTFQGYNKLAIAAGNIPPDTAFRQGMKSSQTRLADDPSLWESFFQTDFDALIIVSDSQLASAKKARNRIVHQLGHFCEDIHVQKGKILRNEHGIGIEHFGYADGVSQPIFLKEEIDAQTDNTVWKDEALLSLALVKDPGGKFPDSFGSYLVFRKLEQRVRDFNGKEEEVSKRFNGTLGVLGRDGRPNDELAGAMIVGRFEDGSEVITNSRDKGITHEEQLSNDFDFRSDNAGNRCPFHAHIRITNPRKDVTQDFAKSVRLVRRGIPFNDVHRDETNLEEDQPNHGVGLLFMCYQADISKQFEFIQFTWANQGNIGDRVVGQDPIIGQGTNATDKQLPAQWGVDGGEQSVQDFHGFVINKGGEYFFTPSISFLKTI